MYKTKLIKTEFKQLKKKEISREFIQNSPTFGVAIDSRGRIIFMNRTMLKALDYQEKEVVGQDYISMFCLERDHESLRGIFEKHIQRWEATIGENVVLAKDRREFLVEWHGCPVIDEKKGYEYHLGVGIDITERKKVEDALRESERKRAEEALRQTEAALHSVFKTASVGIFILKDRVFQGANKAWYKVFGYSESEVIGHTTRMLYENEEECERVGRELYASLLDRGVAFVQTGHRRKDGTFLDSILVAVPLQLEGLCLQMVVAIEDISDRKRAEKELREKQRQLANIIEFLPDATIVIDHEGTVIAWNRAMETMTGIQKKDMIGKGNYEYALPFYGCRRPTLIDLALHPDRETEKQYTAIQRMGGLLLGESFTPKLPPGDIHISASASVLHNEKGEIIAAIECIRDNTERKKLEERLTRAEKMEALGLLAGGIAHDLNNVLGILTGYSELLLLGSEETSPARNYATNIMNAGERAGAIVQDMLTLARRSVQTRKVVNLNSLIRGFMKRPEFEGITAFHPRIRVETRLEAVPLNIMGSPLHIEKTIMNLVSNAVEAMPKGGLLAISTQNQYMDRPVQGYDDIREGDYVVLSVSDSGEGIPENDIRHIFEPFYTKKVMGRSGTGLGLAVVWGTVKDHDGYIDVQSEEGKGCTFRLYFPVTREETAEEHGPVSRTGYMGKGESILVVDDIESQRELAARMLEKLNYRVDAVPSGEEAFDYMKEHSVDLIVLDMIMYPGMDGLDTYRKILEISPNQKAVIVSGFSETDRVREAQVLGAGAYVKKPYVLERIGLAVKRELEKNNSGKRLNKMEVFSPAAG